MKKITRTVLLDNVEIDVENLSEDVIKKYDKIHDGKNSCYPRGFYKLLVDFLPLKEVQTVDKSLTDLEKKFDGDVSLLVIYMQIASRVYQSSSPLHIPVKFHGDGLLEENFVNRIIDEFRDRYYGVFSSTKACKEKIAIQDAKVKKTRNDSSTAYSGGYIRGLAQATHCNENHYFAVYRKNLDD